VDILEKKLLDINKTKIFDEIETDFEINDNSLIKTYEIDDDFNLNLTLKDDSAWIFSLKKFKQDQKNQILNSIEINPLLARELLNENIPYGFFYYLDSKNIDILPICTGDYTLTPSACQLTSTNSVARKDWKPAEWLCHISEILINDKALIFELKGLSYDELYEKAKQACSNDSFANNFHFIEAENIEQISFDDALEQLLLDSIDAKSIFEGFPLNPDNFEKKEFKQKLIEFYETVSSEFDNVSIKGTPTAVRNSDFYIIINKNDLKFFVSPQNNFEFYLKSKGSLYKSKSQNLTIPCLNENILEYKETRGLVVEKETIYNYFLAFDGMLEGDEYSNTSKFLNILFLFAKELVKNNFYKPETKSVDDNFRIFYKTNLNKQAADYLSHISDAFPIYGAFCEETGRTISSENIKYILDDIVNFVVYKILFLKASKFKSHPVTNIFVQNKPVKSISRNKNIQSSIQNWLNYFEISDSKIKPVLKMDKIDDYYCEMSIQIYGIDDKKDAVELSGMFEDTEISQEKKNEILLILNSVSDYLPVLKDICLSYGQYKPVLGIIDTMKLFSDTYLNHPTSKIDILIPKDLKNIIKPKASVKAILKKEKAEDLKNIISNHNASFSMQDLLEFSYEIAIGDEKISKEEFLKLINESDEIIKFKDNYVLLNKDEIKKILEQIENPINISVNSLQFIHSTFSNQINDLEFDYDEAVKELVSSHFNISEITLPEDLTGELRPYQVNGFKWLYSNTVKGFGSCIADDMGLGKTVQVLTLLLKLKEEKKLTSPALVICPTTLVGNWQKECTKFAPQLNTSIYHGTDRKLNTNVDLVITTYGLARVDVELFKKHRWAIVIIDEAQNIKNPLTAQTIAVKSLISENHIAMTGTPIENRLTELWSIFDFTNKGYLDTVSKFQQTYSIPVERLKDDKIANKLKLVTSPFILRRVKTDRSIINDLPEKLVFDEYCYLAHSQAALYENTLNSSMKVITTAEGISRRGNILKLITSLKQICNHPANYLKNRDLSKDISGKMLKTLSILEKILDNNEKCLLFTQYKEMGDILQVIIERELNSRPEFFHGSLSRNERERLITKFQEDINAKIMILSLKAGGTGLNLTAASNVIHYDLWWNPAVENQATDRTYRIGQSQNVTVHRLITLGTFEEKIDELLKEKNKLVDMSLFTGEKMLTDLSNDEIYDIFSLR
jgi:SNF2 family DNA or RNA helicase